MKESLANIYAIKFKNGSYIHKSTTFPQRIDGKNSAGFDQKSNFF